MKLVNLVGFITKKFITMHGHMNVKYKIGVSLVQEQCGLLFFF
jgi:hypothetical protein